MNHQCRSKSTLLSSFKLNTNYYDYNTILSQRENGSSMESCECHPPHPNSNPQNETLPFMVRLKGGDSLEWDLHSQYISKHLNPCHVINLRLKGGDPLEWDLHSQYISKHLNPSHVINFSLVGVCKVVIMAANQIRTWVSPRKSQPTDSFL